MASITAILDKIRGNRRQTELTAAESYYFLLRDVAGGAELDAGDAAIVIEQAEKSDSDFERDVAVMVARIQSAERLRERRNAERELGQAEADLQAAQAKLEASQAKLRPAVTEAGERVTRLNLEILVRSAAENELCQTVLNPAIVGREAEITPRILELASKIEPIDRDYNYSREHLVHLRSKLEVLEQNQFVDTWHTPRQQGIKNDTKRCQEEIDETGTTLRQLERIRRTLVTELDELRSEQAALHQQKLIP